MATKDVIKVLMNQRSKKLFKYLYQLPNYGVGRQFTRVIWKYDGNEVTSDNNMERWGDPLSYWTITRVKPDGVSMYVKILFKFYIYYSQLLKGGKVWGILTWKGIG